ncbi:unnamed protein product [Fusarium equiseti]|uniref:Uncharacterized protein n=1 Tax=Fusarium equiseti TaxID=61235 RepID=A0A8J2NPF3_FUSEQ|nr:unnamed protein product [Fusarium equiseti]
MPASRNDAKVPGHPLLQVISMRSDARDLHHHVQYKSAGPYNDRDEILHYLRGLKEEQHRLSATDGILCRQLRFVHKGKEYKPTVWKGIDYCGVLERTRMCYNKSVMIYVLDPKNEAGHLGDGILRCLDTDFGCHVARTSNIQWEEGYSKPTIEEICRLHKGLCLDLNNGETMKHLPPELLELLPRFDLGKGHGPLLTREQILTAFNKSYILQPTFQALFIVFDGPCGKPEGPFRPGDIGDLPVYLVNTDCHHPEHKESFCQIKTTFNVAIQFVKERSAKENRFPSAPLLDGSADIEEEARKIGWDEGKHGKLPLDRSSSAWVNRNKYTEWTGRGAVRHARSVCLALRFLKSTRREVPYEDYWWWWESPLPTSRPQILVHPHL